MCNNAVMKLEDYLLENSLTLSDFSGRCGVSAPTIFRIKNKQVVPSKSTMVAILEATDGLVTPNDLVGLHGRASLIYSEKEKQ